jgi:N-acetylmuramate 1-kinase
MTIQKTTLAEPLQSWLSGWITTHRKGGVFQSSLLAGDGSDRKFYRIRFRSETFILLSDPTWTLSKDYAPHQAYLESRGVPVPRFLAEDSKVGCLLMEDLGDELLQKQILAHPEQKQNLLTRAAQLLAELHGKTFPVPVSVPCFQRRFDTEKYSQEMQYTWTHLVDAYLGIGPMTDAEKDAVHSFCNRISQTLPLVFSHRDYHTRNILFHKQGLYLIDFQDARMGAPHYDLASLLYDAYVPLKDAERDALIESYRQCLQSHPLSDKIDWKEFRQHLRAIAFQRVVKAAGSFASFYTRFNKKTHLGYIQPALESALLLQGQLDGLVSHWPIRSWLQRLEEIAAKNR